MHRVLIHETALRVDVADRYPRERTLLHVVVHHAGTIFEIEAHDVRGDVGDHLVPIHLSIQRFLRFTTRVLRHLKPNHLRILLIVAVGRRQMEQLLGDAPDIDARAAQSPSRSLGARIDEVQHTDSCAYT